MTRLWWDGAEDPAGLAVLSGSSGVSIVSSPVRSGLKAFLIGYGGYAYKNFSGISEGYFKIGWQISSNYDYTKTIRFRNGTTELFTLGLSTINNKFNILVGGSVVATGSFIYAINTFYLLEFHIKIADTGGLIQLKVEGNLDIDYSGDTQPGAATTIDNLYLSTNYNQATGAAFVYFDDIAINDTNGTVDNSWCGEGRIEYRTTNAAGDINQLTPSAGNNFECVDELAQDGDATYVEGSTVDNRDLYNLAASGLAAGSTINRVKPVASARDTVANGGKIALGMKTNATEYFGSDLVLTTGYTPVQGAEHLVNPNTGVAWTIAELDALQVGVKVRGT